LIGFKTGSDFRGYFLIFKIRGLYGTGSYPGLQNGLQRTNLFIKSQVPFAAPYFSIASSAYSEQVGVNLQLAGNTGDMRRL
jgi:hypothetical protein